jgi:hypothetical protein
MPVKGSIVECGVFKGFGLMSWAKLSAMLEPENFTRRIYGFDTFEGFTALSDKDNNPVANPQPPARARPRTAATIGNGCRRISWNNSPRIRAS